LLDLTRLISRAGRVLTGVDRVELAYLLHLSRSDVALFGIVRTGLGYVLLGADGLAAIADRIEGRVPWGPVDILSRLARRKPVAVRQAESDLRRVALDRSRPRRLPDMLARHLPAGFAYLNTGHSNLTGRMFAAVKGGKGTVAVMIHDVIPLEYPQLQRPGTPETFRAKLQRVHGAADLVIYNSADTQTRAETQMANWGACPPGVVAHLGVDIPSPDPAALPGDLDLDRPYFVTVGTIEPRKNHALLLDVWQDMARDTAPGDIPGLLICGARGWNNEAVFARLDALPKGGPVIELPGLSDEAIAALTRGARGLLFPSIAEGYGLPPIEAASLGTTPVCVELPVYGETMGNIPVYANGSDRYQWRHEIESLMNGPGTEQEGHSRVQFTPPTWDDHFNTVLSYT
jgi:glycosyltransferase involved in cell wall biosynthesis